ncbi:sulfatase-like hydrolase/transferase [candidate division KSB1 bacterium]|nr:sulfatase-like hydrolase/transferase [candidate division KSB1 bacterium]
MERRKFLKLSGCGLLTMPAMSQATEASGVEPPNILLIITDQQFGDLMSCAMGNEYLHTPNMDSLAENGMRFTRAYSPNPLCVPMRTSMITGHYPHQTGVLTNSPEFNPGKFPLMGSIFKKAGYETAYFGKWHIPISVKNKEIHGFDAFVEKDAQLDPEPAAAFIRKKHDRSYLAVASFLSPHEICEWARKEKLPGGSIGEPPPFDERPPMKTNSEPPQNETDIIAYMRKAFQSWESGGRLMFPVANYTEDDWRRHTWGYYRLIERADAFVGRLLQALRESGREENTVVIFLSDHGDCHGAHRWNQKTVFYDESSRVPFIISQKGATPKGTSDFLVNVGVDIFPTLCDFAGIDVPDCLPGLSMKAAALGRNQLQERDYVVSQNHMVQCAAINGLRLTPHGRMVRSERYKYCLYSEGERRESLVDMEQDHGEMVNQAGNPDFRTILNQHRAFLKEFAEKHKDGKALEMLRYGTDM